MNSFWVHWRLLLSPEAIFKYAFFSIRNSTIDASFAAENCSIDSNFLEKFRKADDCATLTISDDMHSSLAICTSWIAAKAVIKWKMQLNVSAVSSILEPENAANRKCALQLWFFFMKSEYNLIYSWCGVCGQKVKWTKRNTSAAAACVPCVFTLNSFVLLTRFWLPHTSDDIDLWKSYVLLREPPQTVGEHRTYIVYGVYALAPTVCDVSLLVHFNASLPKCAAVSQLQHDHMVVVDTVSCECAARKTFKTIPSNPLVVQIFFFGIIETHNCWFYIIIEFSRLRAS